MPSMIQRFSRLPLTSQNAWIFQQKAKQNKFVCVSNEFLSSKFRIILSEYSAVCKYSCVLYCMSAFTFHDTSQRYTGTL